MSTPEQETFGPREFRVTFGGRYPREQHPGFPAANHNGWLTVRAWDYEEACLALHRTIGGDWCGLYAPDRPDYPDLAFYPAGELGYLDGTARFGQQAVISR